MNIDVYKKRVILHYRSGTATDSNWALLGEVMLEASEGDRHDFRELDTRLLTRGEFADRNKGGAG